MSERETTFEHTAQAWTVGELRAALAGLPDDTPVKVNVAEEPGGAFVQEQVVTGAGFGWHRMHNDPADACCTDTEFGLDCEFPTGTYYRTASDDDADGW